MQPTVVVTAYNRPHSLRRLLTSLDEARYPTPVRLVISVDRSESDEVTRTAEDFQWRFGEKRVIVTPEHLGLREHILRCGDLTLDYGSVILLEDDLYVSPFFYEYTVAALAHYGTDPLISGISLYSRRFNNTASLAFTPLSDGSDVFFLQLPSTWGQCWTVAQWGAFRDWYAERVNGLPPSRPEGASAFADASADRRSLGGGWSTSPAGALGAGGHSEPTSDERPIDVLSQVPANVRLWPETSWSKYFINYMIDHGLYFVFPRESLTTNFREPGVHVTRHFTFQQVPLQLGPRAYAFKPLSESNSVYDAYCEIDPGRLRRLAPELAEYDFDVDFYGAKEIGTLTRPYVLTSRKVTSPVQSFALALKPHELNAVRRIAGNDLHLARRADCASDLAANTPERVNYYQDVRSQTFIVRESGDETLRRRIGDLETKVRVLDARHANLRRRHTDVVEKLQAKVRTLERRGRTKGRRHDDVAASEGSTLTKPFRIILRFLREIGAGSTSAAKRVAKARPVAGKGQ